MNAIIKIGNLQYLKVLEELLAMKGGEIKPAYPFRKKKSKL